MTQRPTLPSVLGARGTNNSRIGKRYSRTLPRYLFVVCSALYERGVLTTLEVLFVMPRLNPIERDIRRAKLDCERSRHVFLATRSIHLLLLAHSFCFLLSLSLK